MGTTKYKYPHFFFSSHFIRFFLSLLSVLSLLFWFFVEARNGGLGFAVGLSILGVVVVDSVVGLADLGVVVVDSVVGLSNLGLGLSISAWWWLIRWLGLPISGLGLPISPTRDPPHWPRHKGETYPAGHAVKERPTPLPPSLAVPIPTVWRWWSCADLDLEEWVSAWRWWSRADWLLRN